MIHLLWKASVPHAKTKNQIEDQLLLRYVSLSNSCWHSTNADVIADVKSKIIVQHFSAMWFFLLLQKFKTIKIKSEKNPYTQANKYLLHISKNFKDIFIYILFSLSLANSKQLRKCNHFYRLSLSAMSFSIDIRSNQFRVNLIKKCLYFKTLFQRIV